MLDIITFSNGLLASNSYIVYDTDTMAGAIVDCGVLPSELKLSADVKGIDIKYIILTHGHYDHAEYTKDYTELFKGAKLMCHPAEKCVLCDPEANVSVYFSKERIYPSPHETLQDGNTVALGDSELKCIHTPGHTPGSICLYSKENRIMFTGDTLFDMGYGRTDFKYGDSRALFTSLKKLLEMDGDITFYPGHGSPALISSQYILI